MELGLQGKYALVTGGSHGIGRAIALKLADEGCGVVVCARHEEALFSIKSELEKRVVPNFCIPADVTSLPDRERVFKVLEELPGFHILVNNVGGGGRWGADFVGTTEKVWHEVNQKNLMAAVSFTRMALPLVEKGNWGRVVTISSIFGREAGTRPWFAATKAAEIAFMKSMASDPAWLEKGITFNTVAPGVVAVPDTPWQDTGVSGIRVVRPEEVAAAVVFLCSQQASGITGSCLVVDRGQGRAF